ncbi:MAG TPA: flagellar hook-associated protein FlgK [Candidatus Kapabacteria bacterium]|nr:flagellar hook-associated protein FlgK [Candidatus Kapabacteria bacterium]
MSSFSSLEIGKRALLAQKFGIDNTSNNIANVNTPGFSRRTVVMSETDAYKTNGNYQGTGVQIDLLRSFRQELLDKEMRGAISQQSGYEINQSYLLQITTVFSEPSDTGISELTTEFLNSFNSLAQDPESVALRQSVLENARALTEAFNSTAQGLIQLRDNARSNISQDITKINNLLKDIANLNQQISRSKSQTNSDVQTYVDQRATKIEELAKLTSVTTTTNDDGSVNLFIDGSNVVNQSYSSELRINESINPITGEKTLQLQKYDSESGSSSIIDPQAGELSSLLNMYNVTLDDKDSTGGFSIAKSLDNFANALAQSVNSKTINGYGLDDTTTPPVGRNFFDPSVGFISAKDIKISADIANQPRNIPLSNQPNEPGNNKVALDIAGIMNDQTFLDNQKPIDYYANFLGQIGTSLNLANNGVSTTTSIQTQLETQRQSVMGVNLDEEAIDLIKYQRAFEAASRVINTANEILSTIINLGR